MQVFFCCMLLLPGCTALLGELCCIASKAVIYVQGQRNSPRVQNMSSNPILYQCHTPALAIAALNWEDDYDLIHLVLSLCCHVPSLIINSMHLLYQV